MLKTNYMEYSLALFVYLHLFKLHDIYELEVGKFMYNFVYGNLPHSLSAMFTFVHYIHIYQTRQKSKIGPFNNSTTRSSNSLLCNGPAIWNAIPTCIQQLPSLKRFVFSLKSIVLRGYDDLALL